MLATGAKLVSQLLEPPHPIWTLLPALIGAKVSHKKKITTPQPGHPKQQGPPKFLRYKGASWLTFGSLGEEETEDT